MLCIPCIYNVVCFVAGTPPVTRVSRSLRSHSAGGRETPSPQQSPHHRNRSIGQSPKHHRPSPTPPTTTTTPKYSRSQTPTPLMSRRSPGGVNGHKPQSSTLGRNNTWNATSGRQWTSKQRPQLSEDTFCQQVADIISRLAVTPSPRKDSKVDSPVVTRIPAPVQKT